MYKIFNADLIIPFASFVYFSNYENFHLNKFMNNVKKTSKFLSRNNVNHCFLNPNLNEIEVKSLIYKKTVRDENIQRSINFWDSKFENIEPKKEINKTYEISDEVKTDFLLRIKQNNSLYLLFLIRFLSLKFFFGDIIIYLNDTKETYSLNFFKIKK